MRCIEIVTCPQALQLRPGLTLTWDVLKFCRKQTSPRFHTWLTLTWDVLKCRGNRGKGTWRKD